MQLAQKCTERITPIVVVTRTTGRCCSYDECIRLMRCTWLLYLTGTQRFRSHTFQSNRTCTFFSHISGNLLPLPTDRPIQTTGIFS